MTKMEKHSLSLEERATNIVEANKAKNITIMKLMYHTALNAFSLHSYKRLCGLCHL